MLKKIATTRALSILRNGGKLTKRYGNYLVFEKYTREEHPDYFIGCKDTYTETFVLAGYITYDQYLKIKEEINV